MLQKFWQSSHFPGPVDKRSTLMLDPKSDQMRSDDRNATERL